MSNKKNAKFKKRTTPRTGDIALTTNYRLDKHKKPSGQSNIRPVVVTQTHPTVKVNRIMGVTKQNENKLGTHRIELKHTKTKKRSAVDKTSYSKVYKTKKRVQRLPFKNFKLIVWQIKNDTLYY